MGDYFSRDPFLILDRQVVGVQDLFFHRSCGQGLEDAGVVDDCLVAADCSNLFTEGPVFHQIAVGVRGVADFDDGRVVGCQLAERYKSNENGDDFADFASEKAFDGFDCPLFQHGRSPVRCFLKMRASLGYVPFLIGQASNDFLKPFSDCRPFLFTFL